MRAVGWDRAVEIVGIVGIVLGFGLVGGGREIELGVPVVVFEDLWISISL